MQNKFYFKGSFSNIYKKSSKFSEVTSQILFKVFHKVVFLKFFPRDTKDQIKYLKGNIKKKYHKGDIIFWKGHVAMCLNSKQLIHAYGPEKKVLIMPIIKTIRRIENTAKLKVKKIAKIKI